MSHLPDSPENQRKLLDTTIKQVTISITADAPDKNLARLAEIEPRARALATSEERSRDAMLRLARVYYLMGRVHYYRNEANLALEHYQQVLAVARALGDQELLAIPSSVLGRVMLLLQGQYGKAEPLLAQGAGALAATGDWSEWLLATGYLGAAMAARGEYTAGLDKVRQAIARAREAHDLSGLTGSFLLQWLVHFMGGNLEGMLTASQNAVDLTKQTGDQFYAYLAYGERSLVESRLRNHEAAAASMDECQAIGATLGGQLLVADLFAAIRAELALNAGQLADAQARAEIAVAMAKDVGSVFSAGLARRTWGQALAADRSRWEEAEEHLAESLKDFETGGILVEAARTQRAWGHLLLSRDRPAAARDHLEKAIAVFEAANLADDLARCAT